MQATYHEVVTSNDPDIAQFAHLLRNTFADENLCLDAERISEFLAAPTSDRSLHLVVVKAGGVVRGGTLFSSVTATGAGFSEYMVLDRALRGRGSARRLVKRRQDILNAAARRWGFTAAPGVFIETESPGRTPQAVIERERQTAMDIHERLRLFHHLGFLRVAFPYRQPPLGPGKQPVDYLDLLFCPWDSVLATRRTLEPDFIAQSVAPIFRAWAPDEAGSAITELRERLGTAPVALESLLAAE